ncbi:pyruvate, phosphate dikinase [candidate division WOR-3 bacterium JGI_Cruoil_03_51_56]|uniref:Pyruvate, phosphate dikinase n=1 Tax=candidate division WOR-3 bacterium JGI_Cruoil_03_51_56 TaxID=1973747 RepID=A0A235BUU0_UNCW3|nr:MAG: pyruvate, phosphate dikinase [candidate division WOR-3 bacterium JGI_Cruoil_03_51_56]
MKFIYRFGNGHADGSAQMRDELGGKGANLAEMTNIGFPVPPGFTISTRACRYYMRHKCLPTRLPAEVRQGLAFIEEIVGRKFGDPDNPLLVSVRSGARKSMPGMMDTVLNLGLNDVTVEGLARQTKNERFALDSYRRFIQMFADVVLSTGTAEFEECLGAERRRANVKTDSELPLKALTRMIVRYKALVKERTGSPFPQAPDEQLRMAIEAVLKSWNNQRAVEYRRIYNIPDAWGTAVNIQAMVFGNLGQSSATGVAFTRNPATGERRYYGEYLNNAQGEDIVAGIRTPKPLDRLETESPRVFRELITWFGRLERHYQDVQDVEFTIENGRLYFLQCRNGKRTPAAAVKIAYDMAREHLITQKQAVMRVNPEEISTLLHPEIAPDAKYEVVTKGLGASPGAAWGEMTLSSERVGQLFSAGHKTILVRHQTSAEDVGGMARAQGFLTAAGGMTSHAAVVARGMGKPCVVGCDALRVDYQAHKVLVGNREINEGDIITINGQTGEVICGKVELIEASFSDEFEALLSWADKFKKLDVRTNADNPKDAARAREFGAQGIGLCRTEHMFFGPDRITAMREMILAADATGRRKALAKLLPIQRNDFIGLFRAMDASPVTIRTLDPPLHEFLPKDDAGIHDVARRMGVPVKKVKQTADQLHEQNPMLGFRGCRLGIAYPEISEMQARAIFEAACQVKSEGVQVIPEVMIPLIGDVKEFVLQCEVVKRVAEQVFKKTGVRVNYHVGTMIEVPRAALTAGDIAQEADFFSFGTNDLTQMTFGFSRDDVGRFLPRYLEQKIIPNDPFKTIDTEGVGVLVRLAIRKARRAKPELEIGICGEHGGDPDSIRFCHQVGMDYVSCSPYRVPVARLAAAHAALLEEQQAERKALRATKQK